MIPHPPRREKPALKLAAAALSSLALSACFSAVGRVPFTEEGEKKAVVELKAGDVRFATEVEARYKGRAVARYDIRFLQMDHVVGQAACDPLRMTGGGSCMYRFGNQDQLCEFVMQCGAHLDQGGKTVVDVHFTIPTKPPDFKLRRADLIIGQ